MRALRSPIFLVIFSFRRFFFHGVFFFMMLRLRFQNRDGIAIAILIAIVMAKNEKNGKQQKQSLFLSATNFKIFNFKFSNFKFQIWCDIRPQFENANATAILIAIAYQIAIATLIAITVVQNE